jgi:transposase
MVDPPTQDCCHVALELSRAKWLVGALLPGRSKVSTALVPGGATDALLDVLDRFAARAGREAGRSVPVKVCHEAGHDGFWLARFLPARGVETHVLDPASFLVSRRGRRAKTDRLDVRAMAFTLKAYLLGDRSVCRAVVVPSPEQEDAKRLSRERTQLAAEKTRHANRIRGLLALHGIRERSKGSGAGNGPRRWASSGPATVGSSVATCAPRSRASSSASTSSCGTCGPSTPTARRPSPRRPRPFRSATR